MANFSLDIFLLSLSENLEECKIDIGVAEGHEYESQEGRYASMSHSCPHAGITQCIAMKQEYISAMHFPINLIECFLFCKKKTILNEGCERNLETLVCARSLLLFPLVTT